VRGPLQSLAVQLSAVAIMETASFLRDSQPLVRTQGSESPFSLQNFCFAVCSSMADTDGIILNGKFFSPSKGDMTFDKMLEEIFGYMKEYPEDNFEVIVGTDSPSSDKPFFPIAIVVLRTGFGGRFFLKKMNYPDSALKKFANVSTNWKMRILQEVYLSCELALSLREALSRYARSGVARENELKYTFEYIHADVGEKGKTKEMVKEVTGLIKANGFEPKIKPFSFAATVVADRYT
jgi:predicted RNase H-related nuclease YkuK (DUF458 family)